MRSLGCRLQQARVGLAGTEVSSQHREPLGSLQDPPDLDPGLFLPLAFPEATEEEKQLSLTMMAQWTQFARTG